MVQRVHAQLVVLAGCSPLLARSLLAAFDDLLEVAPADRPPTLETRRARLLRRVEDTPSRSSPTSRASAAART